MRGVCGGRRRMRNAGLADLLLDQVEGLDDVELILLHGAKGMGLVVVSNS